MELNFRALYRHRKAVYIIALVGIMLSSVLIFVEALLGAPLPFPPQTMITIVGVIFFLIPNMMEFSYERWRRRIDDAVPRMLSDVTASVKTGIGLTRSLDLVAERDYGPLTKELKRLSQQQTFGVAFEEAVRRLIRRVPTLMVRRTFNLLLQASRAGGKVEELLDAIQTDANDLYLMEKERKSSLRPYVVITYIAFAVFLAVTILLIDSFFTSVLNIKTSAGPGGGNVFAGLQGLSVSSIKDLLLQMSLIEGIFAGFGAGKLGEGSFSSGFKHVLIMVTVTLLIFVAFV